MIKNYLKTIFRRAARDRLNTLINLFGLSVAITCCLVIFLFVDNELKYDTFHEHANKIYRITTHEASEDGITRNFANSFMPYAPLLESKFSSIAETVRILPQNVSISDDQNLNLFQESNFFYVDPSFLDVFSFPLVQGNKEKALAAPDNILITQAMARKYFGKKDALGEVLKVEQNHTFKVAGILMDPPDQSSLKFDFIVPMAAAEDIWGSWIADSNSTWYYPPVYSFVQLSANVDVDETVQYIKSVEKQFLPENIGKTRTHAVQGLTEVHFSGLENELHPSINRNVLFLFIAVGIVILLVAAFNFVNLFLTKIVLHLKAVGIQKVLGANNRSIWKELLLESFAFLFVSMLLALVWGVLVLPGFNALMKTQLNLSSIFTTGVIFYLMGLLLLLSILISIIPFLIISRFRLIAFLKGRGTSVFKGKKSSSVQSALLVLQFVVAVTLIIATVVMQSQMHYIRKKNLGFQKDQVLVVPVRDEAVQNRFVAVKNKILQLQGVKEVSTISNFPWEKGFYDFETSINYDGLVTKANLSTLLVDENIINTLDMAIVNGRGFSNEHGTDSTMAFIMNEAAASKFGIKNLQNVKLSMTGISSSSAKEGRLIGIVKDFHLQSLHDKIQPLILTVAPRSYYIDNILIQLSGSDVASTINSIEAQLKEFVPGRPFEFFFLDDAFERLYQRESLLSTLFQYFSIIAIIIACLGLLGITAFTTAQRLNEIGIRKVLGSSVAGIVNLLTSGFIKLVLVAIAIAIPLGWWAMDRWLEGFAYKTTIGWWVFALAGISTLAIAMLTVGWQSFKAATTNPVEVLCRE
ncbi:ABC transporter permease [Allomuricauda sp. SCSIO 65647]|uniref:ABC transporter permease n=1 Tax=Allomuricauda sp. SCSIO 65647 TaxID=2908843 RepID=UPI001F394179|nr:ABC transporter permease [Muricauda sp. SCSIO 65647]UJH69161.1 ABC transporter permease [Muricauda sp. SCSIO 65647]